MQGKNGHGLATDLAEHLSPKVDPGVVAWALTVTNAARRREGHPELLPTPATLGRLAEDLRAQGIGTFLECLEAAWQRRRR